MAKRVVSLLMVLTLVLTGFVGAAAEAIVSKATRPILAFVPSSERVNVEAGKVYKDQVLGYFLVDGYTPESLHILQLAEAVDVAIDGEKLDGRYIALSKEGVLSLKSLTAPSASATLHVLVKDTVNYENEIESAIALNVITPITSMSEIKWTNRALLNEDGTLYVGAKSADVDPGAYLEVEVVPMQAGADKGELVVFESSDPSVLLIGKQASGYPASEQGVSRYRVVVEALKAGNVRVSAATSDGKFKKTLDLTVVDVPATGVQIDAVQVQGLAADTIRPEEIERLSVTFKDPMPTDRTGTWRIKSAATLNGQAVADFATVALLDAESGLLTGVGEGVVTVEFTASAKDASGKAVSATRAIAVLGKAPTEIREIVLAPAPSGRASETALDVAISCATVGVELYYTTDGTGPSRSSTPYTGPFRLYRDTTVNVAAYKNDLATQYLFNQFYSFNVFPTSIQAAPDDIVIDGANQQTLTVTLGDIAYVTKEENKVVTVSGDYDKFIDLKDNKDGTYALTGKAVTPAPIELTFTTASGLSHTVSAAVRDLPVTGITLDKESATVAVGESIKLNAIVTPEKAFSKSVRFVGAPSSVIQVDPNTGVVIGVGVGKATIRAIAGSKSAYCNVTVTERPFAVSNPVFDPLPGTFSEPGAEVSLSTATAAAQIYYTTDGTTPSRTNGHPYEGPISLPDNTAMTVKAIAVSTGTLKDSQVVTGKFVSEVKVTKVEITGVLDKKATLQGCAKTLPLGATVSPVQASAAQKRVEWISSNPAVATVDESGLVKSGAVGKATITAKVASGLSDSVEITVTEVKPTGVALSGPSGESAIVGAKANESYQLNASVLPAEANNRGITWTSSNTSIATIDESGRVCVLKYDPANNKVILRATANQSMEDGNKAYKTLEMTVTGTNTRIAKPVITVEPSRDELPGADGTAAHPYTVERAFSIDTTTHGVSIRYTTDGSMPGVHSALYKGPVKMSRTQILRAIAYKDGMADSEVAALSAAFALRVTGITLNKEEAELLVGDALSLSATQTPAEAAPAAKGIVWTSSDEAVAGVDQDGKVVARKVGEAVITATNAKTTQRPVSAQCKLVISPVPVKSVTVLPAELELSVGASASLTAVVQPGNAADKAVTWTSSDEGVAVVENGIVVALKPGKAIVTVASSADPSLSATSAITVAEDPASVPAEPLKIPTYSVEMTGLKEKQDGTLYQRLGKLLPGEGESYAQIDYFYEVAVAGDAKLSALNPTFTVDKSGNVFLVIANVGKDSLGGFSYTWSIKPRESRKPLLTHEMHESRTVTGTTLTVIKRPAAIAFAPASVSEVVMNNAMTKEMALGKVTNIADFRLFDLKVTGTASLGEIKVSEDGSVSLKLARPQAGEYAVQPTLSAEGCAQVKLPAVKVKVSEAGPLPVTAEAVEDVAMKTDESRTVTLGKINDYASLGVKAEAKANLAGASCAVAEDGTVTVTLSKPAEGVYQVDVALTAEGFALTRLGSFKLTVEATVVDVKVIAEGASGVYDGDRLFVNRGDKTVVFKLAGKAATGWKSSNKSILTIDSAGNARLKKTGKVTVTAMTADGAVKRAVSVTNMAKSLTLKYKAGKKWKAFPAAGLTLKAGDVRSLKAAAKSGTALNLKWTSSDASVAEVVGGKLYAKAPGTATVTLSTFNGVKLERVITVTEAPAKAAQTPEESAPEEFPAEEPEAQEPEAQEPEAQEIQAE